MLQLKHRRRPWIQRSSEVDAQSRKVSQYSPSDSESTSIERWSIDWLARVCPYTIVEIEDKFSRCDGGWDQRLSSVLHFLIDAARIFATLQPTMAAWQYGSTAPSAVTEPVAYDGRKWARGTMGMMRLCRREFHTTIPIKHCLCADPFTSRVVILLFYLLHLLLMLDP